MNVFHHKYLGNYLLQLCPKVVKRPVYSCVRRNYIGLVLSLYTHRDEPPQTLYHEQFYSTSLLATRFHLIFFSTWYLRLSHNHVTKIYNQHDMWFTYGRTLSYFSNACYMIYKTIVLNLNKLGPTRDPWAGIAQSAQRLATGWRVRGSNPVGGEIFCTRPDRPWGKPSLLYNV